MSPLMDSSKRFAFVFPLANEVTKLHPSLSGGLGMYFDRRWFGAIPLPREPALKATRDAVFEALESQIESLGLPQRLFAPGVAPKAVRTIVVNVTMVDLKERAKRQKWQAVEPHEVAAAASPAKPKKVEAPVRKAAAKKVASSKPVQTPAATVAQIGRIDALASKCGVKLPSGATEAAIAALESKLGVTLPIEARAFYLAHDGGPKLAPIFGDRRLLPLEGIAREWSSWEEVADSLDDDDDVEADQGVRAERWNRNWIPISSDAGGNGEMLDLSPSKGGKVGQIISVYHDDDARSLAAPDLLTWLEQNFSTKKPSTPKSKAKSVKKPVVAKSVKKPVVAKSVAKSVAKAAKKPRR